jgi:hypothetical protein
MTPKNITIGVVLVALLGVVVYVNMPEPLPPKSPELQAAHDKLQQEGNANQPQTPAAAVSPRDARKPVKVP